MNFSANLKELRCMNGLLQRDIAEKLGCTTQCYCNYEKGKTEPDLHTLCTLADMFDVSLDLLLGRERENDNGALEKTPDHNDNLIVFEKVRKLDQRKKDMLSGYLDCLIKIDQKEKKELKEKKGQQEQE